MQKFLLSLLITLIYSNSGVAQIKPSANNRFLQTKAGQPFFWLGDTAWELFHRLNREEAEDYLEIRRKQGFNMIQAVALAEFNGIREPNRYGDLPLVNEDPTKLAITPGSDPTKPEQYDYWDNVDFVIKKAADKGLYIGLLPTWGDKVAHLWGEGPIIFNPENAEKYAVMLAERYGKQNNVVWVLGGDRPVTYKSDKEGQTKEYNDLLVWQAMAKGIERVLGKEAFITYHISGGANSTSQQIHNENWLDMNSFQSGHGARETEAWSWALRDLAKEPQKPTLDMEPCYEDHPVNPWDGKWTRQRGYFTAYDVRARIYRGVFAGGCGVTYGHHHIWQFSNTELYKPINVGDTVMHWRQAALAPAAGQMQYLKNLMLSRPYESRIADQSLILSNKGQNYQDLVFATRDEGGTYAMVYLPQNKPVDIDLRKISGTTKNSWWYNPLNGEAIKNKPLKTNTKHSFIPPKTGKDWILVIDDAARKYKTPGKSDLAKQ